MFVIVSRTGRPADNSAYTFMGVGLGGGGGKFHPCVLSKSIFKPVKTTE